MKKIILVIAFVSAVFSVFSQKNYGDFDTVANVVVKTKIAHAKAKDTTSNIELSIFFQNIGTKEIVLSYEIYITDGEEIRHSGLKTMNIRPQQKQAGKISGLNYTLIGNNIDDYITGAKQWHFTTLEVKDADTGEILGTSKKVRDKDDIIGD